MEEAGKWTNLSAVLRAIHILNRRGNEGKLENVKWVKEWSGKEQEQQGEEAKGQRKKDNGEKRMRGREK